jgi:hypothetical protein
MQRELRNEYVAAGVLKVRRLFWGFVIQAIIILKSTVKKDSLKSLTEIKWLGNGVSGGF